MGVGIGGEGKYIRFHSFTDPVISSQSKDVIQETSLHLEQADIPTLLSRKGPQIRDPLLLVRTDKTTDYGSNILDATQI